MTPSTRPDRPARPVRRATVQRTERLSPHLVRVTLQGDDLAQLPELAFTDHYVKLLFAPEGADYAAPFDPDEVQATRPREQWPVTRTYTIHGLDRDAGTLLVDFVVHGDEGLAGPWAQRARPGDQIQFRGPGGAWAPAPDAAAHVLVGDESAWPAIQASLQRLPQGRPAHVLLEVENAAEHLPVPELPGVQVTWVHRDDHGGEFGSGLVQAVLALPELPAATHWFVHGNAEMIKQVRRHLFVELQVPREQVSISGYWRPGQNEDAWQAGKREFNAAMEAEQDGGTQNPASGGR